MTPTLSRKWKKSNSIWLIDGYNLLHSLKSRKPPAISGRGELLLRLGSYAAAVSQAVFVVFDGVGDEKEFASHRSRYFHAFYSQGDSADTVIERYAMEHKKRKGLRVVTDDAALSGMARGTGACVVGTDEFLRSLKGVKREGRDFLFNQGVRSHGFHRPFEGKL